MAEPTTSGVPEEFLRPAPGEDEEDLEKYIRHVPAEFLGKDEGPGRFVGLTPRKPPAEFLGEEGDEEGEIPAEFLEPAPARRRPVSLEAEVAATEREVRTPEERSEVFSDLYAERVADAAPGEEVVHPSVEHGEKIPEPFVGEPGFLGEIKALVQAGVEAKKQQVHGYDPKGVISETMAKRQRGPLYDLFDYITSDEEEQALREAGQQTSERATVEDLAGALGVGQSLLRKANLEQYLLDEAKAIDPERKAHLSRAQMQQMQQDLAKKLDETYPESFQAKSAEEGRGTYVESPIGAGLRFYGTLLEAGLLEPLLSTEVQGYTFKTGSGREYAGAKAMGAASGEMYHRVMQGESAPAVLADMVGSGRWKPAWVSVEEALLDLTPEKRGNLSDVSLAKRSGLTHDFHRILTATKHGMGLAELMEAGAMEAGPEFQLPTEVPVLTDIPIMGDVYKATLGGMDFSDAMWWGGLVGSMGPFEDAFVKPTVQTGKALAAARRAPQGAKLESFAAMLRGDADPGRAAAGMIMDEIASGKATPWEAFEALDGTTQSILREMAQDADLPIDTYLDLFRPADESDIGFDPSARMDLEDPALSPKERSALAGVEEGAPPPASRPKPDTPAGRRLRQAEADVEQARAGVKAEREAAEAGVSKAVDDAVEPTRSRLSDAQDKARQDMLHRLEQGMVPDAYLRTRSMDHWIEQRKLFNKAFTIGLQRPEARQILDLLTLRNFRSVRHDGGEALRWLAPEQTPQGKHYRVIDGAKNVIQDKLDLEGAIDLLRRRRGKDDKIVSVAGGPDRTVAGWRGRTRKRKDGRIQPEGEFVAHHNFSLPEEAAIIDRIDDVLTPDEVIAGMGLGSLADSKGVQAAWRALTDRPIPLDVKKLTAADLVFADLLKDAISARLGWSTRPTKLVAGGVRVTEHQRQTIVKRLQKEMKDTGWSPFEVEFVDGVAQLDDAQRAAAERYFGRYAMILPDEVTRDWFRESTGEIMRTITSRAQHQKWAHQGMGPLSEELVAALGQAFGAKPEKGYEFTKKVFVGNLDFKRLPKGAREAYEKAASELMSAQDKLRREIKSLLDGGATREEALTAAMPDYYPVTADEMVMWDTINSKTYENPADAVVVRDEVSKLVKNLGDYPGLRSDDLTKIKGEKGLTKLHADLKRRMVDEAKNLILSHLSGNKKVEWVDAFGENFETELLKVWRSYLDEGLQSDGIRAAAEQVAKTHAYKTIPQEWASLQFVSIQQARVARKKVLQELAEESFGIASPVLIDAAQYLLKGTGTKHPFTELELAQAANFLDRWGLRVGDGVQLQKLDGVAMPPELARELERAAMRGLQISADGIDSTVFKGAWRGFKDGITTAQPKYHITNWLSLPFMAFYNRGVRGLSDMYATIAENPELVWALTERVSAAPILMRFVGGEDFAKVPLYRRQGDRRNVLVTDLGDVWSADELERAIAATGAGDTVQSQANVRAVAEDLDRYTGEVRVFGMNLGKYSAQDALDAFALHHGVYMPPVEGLDQITAATAFAKKEELREAVVSLSEIPERAYRIGVFVQELKRGATVDQAGKAARESMFDYTKLTDLDRWINRNAIVFWTFRRKNLDRFLENLADNPGRLGGMLRFANKQQEGIDRGSHGEENVWARTHMTETDFSRLHIWRTQAGPEAGMRDVDLVSGGVNNAVDGFVMLNQLVQFPLFLPSRGVYGSSDLLASGASPQASLLVESLTGTRLGQSSGPYPNKEAFRVSAPKGNLIPPLMLEGPFSVTVENYLDTEDVELGPRQADQAYKIVNGKYIGLAPKGAKSIALWRTLQSVYGRPIHEWYGSVSPLFAPEGSFGQKPYTTPDMDILGLGATWKMRPTPGESRARTMTEETREARAELYDLRKKNR
jgi:hypothetical protein